jgi:hypothetical protein
MMTLHSVRVTKGLEFRHANWLEADYKTPLLCRVTAVRKGIVYWKAVEHGEVYGSTYTFEVEDFARYAKSE